MDRAKQLLGFHETGILLWWGLIGYRATRQETIWSGLLSREVIWRFTPSNGRPSFVTLDRDVKINTAVYLERVLEGVLKSCTRKHFARRPWLSKNQRSLTNHPSTKNGTLLDFFIWGIFKSKVSAKPSKLFVGNGAKYHIIYYLQRVMHLLTVSREEIGVVV